MVDKPARSDRWLDFLAIFVLFVVASYLRIGDAGIIEYKRDEANLSQLALEFAHGENFPLLGIGSSVGFPNAPINVYVLAFPYLITDNPQFATQFIGLLNVVAVLMTYGIARRYCNPLIAFGMTLLYAVSPWSLIFSRKIWAQNMLPPFIVGVVITGILGFVSGKRWAQWLHLPLLVIVGQIHYAAFVILTSSVYLIWQGRRNLTRAFWLSIIPAILLTLPYLIGLQQANLLSADTLREAMNTANAVNTANAESETLITFDAVDGAAILISGTQIHSLAGAERFLDYLDTVPDVYPIFNLLALALVLSTLWLIYRSLFQSDSRTPIDVAVLLWLIFPIFAFSLSWTPFYIHYLIPIFPAAFLVIGFSLQDVHLRLQKMDRVYAQFGSAAVLVGAVSVIIFLQVLLWSRLLVFLDEEYTPDGFGTPIHYLLDVRDFVLERSATQVIGDLGGQAIGFDGEPSVWNTLLFSVDHVRFQDANTDVFPADTSVLLTRDCDTAEISNSDVFPLRHLDEGCYAVSERLSSDLDLTRYDAIDRTQPSRFANGVEILAYDWDESDGCLQLVWEITQTTQEDYMFAVHFSDENGNGIGNADGLSWFGRYWLPGDRVVRRFCLAHQIDSIAEVGIGMYTYDGTNFYNVDLLDESNVPAGQTFVISLRSES
ncbi:MAG: hypothetical protein RLP44_02785 [Aggregatilineales bacterium]